MYLYSRAVIIAGRGGAKRERGGRGHPRAITRISLPRSMRPVRWAEEEVAGWRRAEERGEEENMDINADAIKYGYIDYLFLCPVFFARAAAPLHHPADRTDGPCTVCVFSPLAPV